MKDTKSILNCPACGCEMKKVKLDSTGFFVDICADGCGGIWLDNRELDKIDEEWTDIHKVNETYTNKEYTRIDTTKMRLCPVCGAKMVKNYASAKREIEVDECYFCGGKFLDNHELEAIRHQYRTDEERSNDAVKLSLDLGSMRNIFEEILSKDLANEE